MEMAEVGGTDRAVDPGPREVWAAVGIALAFVAATRWPLARSGPVETDEWMFVARMGTTWLPIHHTLFQTAGRALGIGPDA